MKRIGLLLRYLLLGAAVAGPVITCSDVQLTPPVLLTPPDTLTTDATVQFLVIERACWVLAVSNTLRLEPVNLPSDFRVDGLEVEVTVRSSPNASVCMTAPLVEIIAIRRR